MALAHTFLDTVDLTIDMNGHFLGYFNSVPDGTTVREGDDAPQIHHRY